MNRLDTTRQEIEIHKYIPTSDRPGCLTFLRNITPTELHDEITRLIPKDLEDRLEWYVLSTRYDENNKTNDTPLPSYPQNKYAELLVTWSPGDNEGYTVKIHARAPNTPLVWHAKTFDVKTAIELHLYLTAWLHGNGLGMARTIAGIIESAK